MHQSLPEVFPISTALWIITLYVLAFFRILSFIDFISVVLIVFCIVLFCRKSTGSRIKELEQLLFSPAAISIYLVLILAFLLFRDLKIADPDDTGCWALEVKSIFYYNGFAPRAKNAAVLYGDYFPGTSLFRWWCCHLLPEFNDGMLAVGSAWLYIIILAPIFRFTGRRFSGVLLSVLVMSGLLLSLPGVIDSMCYRTICAELPMSAAFAMALYALFFSDRHVQLPLFATNIFFLAFFKSSGIVYAVFLILLALILKRHDKNIPVEQLSIHFDTTALFRTGVFCMIPTLSWCLYCTVMSRSSYFTVSIPTGTFSDITSGTTVSAATPILYLKSLVQSFFFYPSNYVEDGIIHLSPFAFVTLLILLYYFAGKHKLIPPKKANSFIIFFITAVITLLICLFFMFSFVFMEEQYLDPYTASVAISRYSLPLLLGSLIFILCVFVINKNGIKKLLTTSLIALCVCLCTCPWTIYYSCIDRTEKNQKTMSLMDEISSNYSSFLSQAKTLRPDNDSARYVIVLYEAQDFPTYNQCHLQYIAAPDSILFFDYQSLTGNVAETLLEFAMQNNSDYIYFHDSDMSKLRLSLTTTEPGTSTIVPVAALAEQQLSATP